jgi:hypothetical protein
VAAPAEAIKHREPNRALVNTWAQASATANPRNSQLITHRLNDLKKISKILNRLNI